MTPDDAATTGDAVTGVVEEPTPEERRALFRVVRGTPTDAELAALTVALLAAAPAPEPTPAPRSAWVDRGSLMRRPVSPGPAAWRTSMWPR